MGRHQPLNFWRLIRWPALALLLACAPAWGAEDALEQQRARGAALWQQGEYAQAVSLLQNVFDQARAGRRYATAAQAATDLAGLYIDLGNSLQGMQVLQAAEDVISQLPKDDLRHPAAILATMLEIPPKEGDPRAALNAIQLARSVQVQLKDEALEVTLHAAIGRLRLSQRDFKGAAEAFGEAADRAGKRQDGWQQSRALVLRAEALLRQGETLAAEQTLAQLQPLAERQGLRAVLATVWQLEAKLSLLRDESATAERQYAAWWTQEQRLWRAVAGLDDATLRARQRRQRPVFDDYFGVLAGLYRTTGEPGWARRAYALTQDMKAAGLSLVSQPASAVQGVQRSLAAREALLEYVVTDSAMYVFVLRPDAFELVDLGTPQWALRYAGIMRLQLEAGQDGALEKLSRFEPARANALYASVVEPARKMLGSADTAYIAPDKFLHGLPFQALVTRAVDNLAFRPRAPAPGTTFLEEYGAQSYLADELAIAYLPAGSALPALRDRSHARPRAWSRPLIAFADPIFAPGDRPNAAGLKRLAASADEARGVREATGGQLGDLYLRDEATVARVIASPLAEARFLLFSTHGVLGPGVNGDLQPGLLFTPTADAPAGLLVAPEVMALRLRAQMVVLSACRMAGDDDDASSALPRAFLAAGADSVLASQWMVESEATRDLVVHTFRTLASAAPPGSRAQALQAAQRALRSGPARDVAGVRVSMAHPFFWAGFVLVGLAE